MEIPCSICGKKWSNLQSLQDHQRGVHKMGTPYVCACGTTFHWRKGIARHKKKCATFLSAVSGQDVNATM